MTSTHNFWPNFSEEEAQAVKETLLSNNVNYWTGFECREFEKEFATWVGVKHAVALMNGTVALDLALQALNIGEGDEVVVTSRTFIASVSSIVNAGARPIFADIDRETQNISAFTIEPLLTHKTKAILCVHLAGWPCDMDPIMEVAEKHSLLVIEDCAQAHGAMYKGKSVGSIGHVGAWSFCQDKIMTTGGEGGMVTTNDELLWKKMWAYKDHGKSYDTVYHKMHPPGFRWLHESFGTNWRMTEIQATIGRIQLKRMPEWTRKRNENQNLIWDVASKLKGIRVPKLSCVNCLNSCVNTTCVHAAYKCYIFVEPEQLCEGWTRDRIIEEINELGVPCFSGSCSEVYLEKAFDRNDLRPKKRLRVAKELGETSLMFLVHPTLSKAELDLTCQALSTVMLKATS